MDITFSFLYSTLLSYWANKCFSSLWNSNKYIKFKKIIKMAFQPGSRGGRGGMFAIKCFFFFLFLSFFSLVFSSRGMIWSKRFGGKDVDDLRWDLSSFVHDTKKGFEAVFCMLFWVYCIFYVSLFVLCSMSCGQQNHSLGRNSETCHTARTWGYTGPFCMRFTSGLFSLFSLFSLFPLTSSLSPSNHNFPTLSASKQNY